VFILALCWRRAAAPRRGRLVLSSTASLPPCNPGTQQQAIIFITNGELADTELKSVYDASLTLKVTNADDTAGRKLLVFNSDLIEAMRMERLVLRGS
jgi:hypothetical protein